VYPFQVEVPQWLDFVIGYQCPLTRLWIKPPSPNVHEALRVGYPEVAIFRDFKTMMQEFPVSDPRRGL
jgi:hypothetical protein